MTQKDPTAKLLKSLKRIESKLDVIISLQKASLPKPTISPTESEILKLCDKKHTVKDMMIKTGKTETNINSLLTKLRKKVLITTVKVDSRKVYERI